MADEIPRTLKEKLLFYTTAFFILLGIFSLFAFLFLVPFVIEPGFTTIFMEFDTRPALCVTTYTESRRGASNCTWSSCREGCTKELFECFQISVKYKPAKNETNDTEILPTAAAVAAPWHPHRIQLAEGEGEEEEDKRYRRPRAIRDYNYDDDSFYEDSSARLSSGSAIAHKDQLSYNDENFDESLGDQYGDLDYGNGTGMRSEWFVGARLFPNVKGCGYPPSLNCTIWTKKYKTLGTNFSCYYSRVDPALVVSDLDMWQNTLYLIYSLAIPIPSFIISVIYLVVAYFKIYNDDEEQEPLDKNAEEMADDGGSGSGSGSRSGCGSGSPECGEVDLDVEELEEEILVGALGDDEICIVLESGSVPDGLTAAGTPETGQPELTNSTDLPSSVRAQLNNDEAGSRGSTDHGVISNSGSIPG